MSGAQKSGLYRRAYRRKLKLKNVLTKLVTYGLPLMAAAASVAPFIFMLLISFQHTFFVSGNPARWIPKKPTLDTYMAVLQTPNFVRWLFNSLLVASCVTIIVLLIQSMAGYVFAKKKFPGRDLIFIVILSGIMIPRAVTIIPVFFIAKYLKILNTYPGLILPPLAVPLGVFLMRQYMRTLPSELLDASRIDGCSEFRTYWRIVLPLSKPGLAVLGIYTFMEQWRDFLWPLIATQKDYMKTLPVGLSVFHTEFRTDYGIQMAAVLLSVLPFMIVFLYFQRYFIKGMTVGALKG
jgi:ABC-type glycerol-3-phosphate transport system permease component